MKFFQKKWWESHLKQIKNKAKNRYTPELNVNLPISEIFDGISRNKKFYNGIRLKYGEIFKEFRTISSNYENKKIQKEYLSLKERIVLLFKLIETRKSYNTERIPWDQIKKQSIQIEKLLWNFADMLREEKELVKDIKSKPREDGGHQFSAYEKLNYDLHHINEVQRLIFYFKNLSTSSKAKLSNNPLLLLTGSAGTGKTHLLCDLAEQRLETGLPTFLVFGEFFIGSNFWDQFLKQLILSPKKDEFLNQIDLAGKRNQCRSFIIIDAINENIESVPNFWKKNLSKIVSEIKKYPNIGLIISVRSGFENEVLTEYQKKLFIHEEHTGFRFREWEAVNKFFSSFGIPLPEIPLLTPEFQRPLFLLLFCRAFKNRSKKKLVFKGHEGATFIFENYVDTISKEIEDDFKIDHGPKKSIWDTIIEKIAEQMVERNSDRITEEALIQIILKSHPTIEVGKFIRALESNLLILKVPRYLDNGLSSGFDIRFPFQKFSDHLVGRYIFKKYEKEFGKANKNIETAKKFFSERRNLGKFILKGWNRGIIEALSIQTPEHLKGIEFISVISDKEKNSYLSQMLNETFIESLIWRSPKAFSQDPKSTLDIINNRIIKTEDGHRKLLNAFLSISPIPGHPFNAERLHNHLIRFDMPKRDSSWSTFLHYQYGEHEAVDRLLQWAWSDNKFTHISDESIFLLSMVLSWFLTTPNRYVRDKATKGLVSILQDRIPLITKLLQKFENVNDPYITERLYAVAYGCCLRNKNDNQNIKVLTEWIYQKNFKTRPPVHILMRDYARGIIEIALERKLKVKVLKTNCLPPYGSRWPNQFPKLKNLRKKYYPEDFFKDKTKDRGYLDIWSSIMYDAGTLGDFGHYEINSSLYRWTGRKIKNPEPNKTKLFNKFKTNLNSEQKELLEKATNPFFGISRKKLFLNIKILDSSNTKKPNEKQIESDQQKEKRQKQYFRDFKNSVTQQKRNYFEKEIEPFLDSNGYIRDPFDKFDTSLAQAWIFNRVINLGYDPKLHGEFDSIVNRYDNSGRSAHKAERIGKKYQWIAYHEFMAMVADHFEFKDNYWSNTNGKRYKGPWNPYMRDIDPSLIVQNDKNLKEVANFNKWKKGVGKYDAWQKTKSNNKWLQINRDLPDPKQIIEIEDDGGKKWFSLKGIFVWQQETPPEFKKYDIPSREIFYILQSYIVKKKDYKKITSWIAKKEYGNWLSDSQHFYECFIGEYPNSFTFNNLRGNYNIWTKSDDLRVPYVVTDDSYLYESTLDCSYENGFSVSLPSKWLVNEMELDHKYCDGRYFDKKDNLIAYTTRIFEEFFPSTLLIDKNTLIKFLESSDYAIFWAFRGEKQIIGTHSDFLGRLNISGVYGIDDKTLKGNIKSNFESPHKK